MAFGETGLESVAIPSSVRIIHQSAFCLCKNLRYAMINEGLETLGTDEYKSDGARYFGVFQEDALEHVIFPSTLKRIEYRAFMDCERPRAV